MRLPKVLVLLLLACLLPAGMARAETVGHVSYVHGVVLARDADGQVRVLKRGDRLRQGEVVSTFFGRVQMRLNGGSFVALAHDTTYTVDDSPGQSGTIGSGFFGSLLFDALSRGCMGAMLTLWHGGHHDYGQIKTATSEFGNCLPTLGEDDRWGPLSVPMYYDTYACISPGAPAWLQSPGYPPAPLEARPPACRFAPPERRHWPSEYRQ